jgi:hypothetical protein
MEKGLEQKVENQAADLTKIKKQYVLSQTLYGFGVGFVFGAASSLALNVDVIVGAGAGAGIYASTMYMRTKNYI